MDNFSCLNTIVKTLVTLVSDVLVVAAFEALFHLIATSKVYTLF